MVRVRVRWCAIAVLSSALSCSVFAGPVEDAERAYEQRDYALAVTLYQQAAEATPALRDDEAFMAGWRRAEARAAYDQGTRLHTEHQYDAAVEKFMLAIAKDSELELAYTALEDAQRAGIQLHLLESLEAADQGDLLTAKKHLEQSLVLGGGAEKQITTALASIVEPDTVFDEATLKQLTDAQLLASDRQWELAEQKLKALVLQAPLLLPARAELSRVSGIKSLSVTLTDEAVALIAQQRLSPAHEKLASATTVWPYNKRAAELLESLEAKLKRVQALVEDADRLQAAQDWRSAYEKLAEALAIDPSHADARSLRSQVRVGLVKMLSEEARTALAEGDTARARELIDRGDAYWRNNRITRLALADYQVALSDRALDAGHNGEAYLRALLASRDVAIDSRLSNLERAFINDTQARYVYDIVPYSPSIGVGSGELIGALASQAASPYNEPASCIRFMHGQTEIDLGPPPAVQANDNADENADNNNDADRPQPQYHVRIQITSSDIDLRQRQSTGLNVTGTTFGTDNVAFNSHYWEKYGTVQADILITDLNTGQEIGQWNSSRWANYTDRRQYVIGNTWQDSYWTLPTDEEIAARLAQDLAAQIHPQVVEAITLAQARSLQASADALANDDPARALDLQVSAVILAGQINPRPARIELWRLARELDQQQPTPAK